MVGLIECLCECVMTEQDALDFVNVCEMGDIDTVLDMLENPDLDIHYENELAFRGACRNGRTEIVKLLLSLRGDRKVNIHTKNGNAFMTVCHMGYTDIVGLLLPLLNKKPIRYSTGLFNAYAELRRILRGEQDVMTAHWADFRRRVRGGKTLRSDCVYYRVWGNLPRVAFAEVIMQTEKHDTNKLIDNYYVHTHRLNFW